MKVTTKRGLCCVILLKHLHSWFIELLYCIWWANALNFYWINFYWFLICYWLVPVPVIIDWAQIQGKQYFVSTKVTCLTYSIIFRGKKTFKQNVLNECSVDRMMHNDLRLYIAVWHVSIIYRLSQSFDVITELGEGGFGCVYKVKHKFDGKIYAVKKVVLTG